jgi:hypothetical protein
MAGPGYFHVRYRASQGGDGRLRPVVWARWVPYSNANAPKNPAGRAGEGPTRTR